MNQHIDLNGAKVFVTGATGFIGSRLIEYLLQYRGVSVRALTRHFGNAVYLARFPVELVPGDILDPESLRKELSGVDFVFHCAAGIKGDDQERYQTTVEGTKNTLDAALSANIKRFIHVSTIAVHGPNPGRAVVDESTPLRYSNDVYSDSKIEAEKIALQFSEEKGLPVVILRPTIVYGPRSGAWTLGPVNSMKQGTFTLINEGMGIANPVYVDDVVQAMLLGAVCPEAVGEEFIISYGSGVTWQEFYDHYARMMGFDLPILTLEEIELRKRRLSELRNPFNLGLSFVSSPHAQSVLHQMPGTGKVLSFASKVLPEIGRRSILGKARVLRETKLNPPYLPKQSQIDFYKSQSVCKIDKAQRLLGYQPQFSLEKGMELTEAWLRYEKII